MSTISTLRVGAVGAVLALVMGAAAQTASARSEAPPQPARAHSAVQTVEEETARAVAASLGDSAWRDGLRAAARSGTEIDLAAAAAHTPGAAARTLAASVAEGNTRVLAAKGLDAATGPLLRLRLGDPSMRAALDAGTAPWVAAAPASDRATTLTAYDSRGRAHTLAAAEVPEQPIYLVDIDVTRALAGGAEILRRTLGGAAAVRPQAAAADGWWGTKIDAIEVSDDEEPWFKGAAEMYALVTGFGTDGKVRVDPVDMPYLDYDGTVYRPNQILVNWSNYKYNLADVVLMEEDGSTNYQALAKAIAAVLLTITDQGAYIPLVNAVLDAIPTEWWTDDPDYVDSWYTLARTSSGRLNGARANGWMSVSPYWVSAF
ncbi:hypothetical protein BX265_1668 [Streptomyces sp. TLI_235]|nr:DUF3103 domain-containing protein [Streptomyces sp. TLI_235]PBC76947.1 hypothetical protein BX265_1668 [Streptomyces sp. TLI_235]